MGPFCGLALNVLLILIRSPSPTRSAEPESNFVELRCGTRQFPNNVTRAVIYFTANMETISNKVQSNRFGISSTGSGSDKTYGLAQCYNYLSQVECDLCFSKLRTVGPLCYPNIGGRVYLDGCFLRVDDYAFFKEALGPTDHAICGNTTRYGSAFVVSVGKAVAAAVSQAEVNDGYGEGRESSSAYAMASCLRTLDAGGCRECLSNASASARWCLPWSEGRVDNTGCFLRYSYTNFLSSSSKGSRTLKILAIACSVAIVGLGSAVGVLLWKHNSIIQKRTKGMNKVSMKMASALSKSSLNFKYSTLVKATSSFDAANKLGEGGFGTVYKGVLADGREVAVKRLFMNNRHRVMDFFNEINIISSVEHKNLVRLLGCSLGLDSLLVYEYLPNMSLDRFIFDDQKGKELDWEKRFKIIVGTARGLSYLHENPKARIIHRDIKASNVLLDSKLLAKIADFGLARSFSEDKSHISTAVVGTLGYMAPEYVAHGQLTEKADVYSFGVLLLEIISGKQNCKSITSLCSESLLTLAWKHFQSGTVEDLIDPNIYGGHDMKPQILRTVHIAFLCTQESPSLRPSMSRALMMLMRTTEEPLPTPTDPPFTDEDTMELREVEGDSHHLLYENESSFVATLSHSTFYPR
ncbi:Cysteine-rich receptor-like protein kinase 2 [Acorus calamus]|uniref:Cysteine-rich receptor-like protein kinase 2 n=1 Tax=Acorus calamus TaxID=4465 RepID=A0AAV9DQP2_ACOCL|nr:Cysteine-rich receptor-like protein kinase 2 [Acorus calamus]